MAAKNINTLLKARETQGQRTRAFQRHLHVHRPFIERLGLERDLEGHAGCVNCLEWNSKGDLLASGSDDLSAIIWEPFKYRKKVVISTGHMGNIFSVKFLPNTGDRAIATAAADSNVRIHNVETCETMQSYNCHIGRVKRLATAPSTSQVIYSASEDGTVRQFDLRQPHSCNSTSKNCKNVLINLNIHVGAMAEAKCLAINPLRPEMLAVGCNDPFVRLYDHRMLSSNIGLKNSGSSSPSPDDARLPPGCVRYFAPGHLPPRLSRGFPRRVRAYVATFVTFGPNGYELLANLGGEQVYLFDVREQRKAVGYMAPNGVALPHSTNGVVKEVVSGVGLPTNSSNGYFVSPNGATNGYKVANGKKLKSGAAKSPANAAGCEEIPAKALELKARGNEAFIKQQFWSAVNLYNSAIAIAPNSAILYANRAAAYIKRAWDGDIYAALRDCHIALSLDPNHAKALFRQARCLYELRWCQEALSCMNHFKERFPDQAQGNAAKMLERDIRAAAFAETEECDKEDDPSPPPSTAEGSTSGQRRRRPSLMSDQERTFRASPLDYERRFCGHCNTTTDIKEASFFGSNGQYIVAGSDDGSFFVWNKETTNLERVLKGDDSIVNCLQPHPSTCLLATSGIDPVIRLWSPRPLDGSVEDRHVDEIEAAARANQKRMNADPLEVMLMNMGNRTRFSVVEGSDEEGDEGPIHCRMS